MIRDSIEIARKPEDVFAYIDQLERHGEWQASILAVKLENPGYFQPLTSTLFGRIVLILAAAWAVAGSYVIKKIVEIEV